MSEKETKYRNGDAVSHKEYGKGVVLSVEFVELPSDSDHTFYRIQFEDGTIRNLKAGELRGKGILD